MSGSPCFFAIPLCALVPLQSRIPLLLPHLHPCSILCVQCNRTGFGMHAADERMFLLSGSDLPTDDHTGHKASMCDWKSTVSHVCTITCQRTCKDMALKMPEPKRCQPDIY